MAKSKRITDRCHAYPIGAGRGRLKHLGIAVHIGQRDYMASPGWIPYEKTDCRGTSTGKRKALPASGRCEVTVCDRADGKYVIGRDGHFFKLKRLPKRGTF
jgi:hypothetical protein